MKKIFLATLLLCSTSITLSEGPSGITERQRLERENKELRDTKEKLEAQLRQAQAEETENKASSATQIPSARSIAATAVTSFAAGFMLYCYTQ